MITTANIAEIRAQVKQWHMQGETVAFVPTMGNLHNGHITLVTEALKRADHVVVSIFVNPMQFGQNEDLDAYPRTLAADSDALINAGAELLFTPTPSIIYPKGLAQQTFVEVPNIGDEFCGASRPGHFRGVATIVCKLFNIVQADVALFGRKDYQQLMVIKAMAEDLSLPIEIIGIDTIREASGLAMSSRNGYLTAEQKQQAAAIKQCMDKLAADVACGKNIAESEAVAAETLVKVGFKMDYLSVRNATNLAPITSEDHNLVILVAAYLGNTRLIDNLTFSR
ncbi:pantoate--beta-alanine ligase [Shewanella sp. 1_MG-2023]|uniref:pantoate--beta-alanine ligase n=1 Tax=unclassified Shewanella TaxID=196818 RepID=UPI0026E38D39|nr:MULTISPECIES: pantoate--beta-alanine ligase [unclassified Shewanella]MDO6611582.1 pantoate--beta-alanine ligase [Shewanella sp. 7_MG-2023]MDO6771437.1 pantoate--beta-alanine ligase [Shewanella sp. 2_MG-2023]MDO6793663.1 pantoate--beta-alanine ligase [Shewanella sp. 1_MG-2023]